VDLSDVAERIYFQDRDNVQRFGSEIALREIDRNDPEQPESSVLRVSPREDLPAGRTFDLILDGVRAKTGGKPLPFLQRFPLGTTQPLKIDWLGAFNAPREEPIIRAKFSEELIPESVNAGDVSVEPAVPKMKVRAVRDEIVVEGEFDVKQRYRVTIARPCGRQWLLPRRGFPLGRDVSTEAERDLFSGAADPRAFHGWPEFAFVQTNTGPAKWRLAALPIEKFAEVEKRLREFDERARIR